MADRSIVVRLRAQADGFKTEMAAAAAAAEKVGKAGDQASTAATTGLGRMVRSATQHREAWTAAGATLTGFGAAALGALGLATKAALDWESSWAGVMKTVDASPAQYAELEEGLRGLARELPATHQEIAAVAEAAGQLGIQRESIVDFTRTMVNLGETTNLTADEAATSIAQLANVMGTSAGDIDNLGSSLVALGNNGASTEKDILMMAQRLGGTGNIIGASEQDILGLSSALADVGISAEAGGGSISRVLQNMNTAVLDGGTKLEAFAKVAGVSADEFAQKWKSSPVEAFDLFRKGLNGVTTSGGNAVATLRDLGIKSSEETRAILSLAGNTDGLTNSLKTANSEWDMNTALTIEAAKRYETTEAQIGMARNALVDLGIDIGSAVLPALAGLAQQGAGAVRWLADLPAPVHAVAAGLLAAGGAAATGAGGFLLLAPRVLEAIQAFKTLKDTAPGVTSAMTGVGKWAAGLGAVFVAGGALSSMLTNNLGPSIEQIAGQLTKLGNADDAFSHWGTDIFGHELMGNIHGVGDAFAYMYGSADPVNRGADKLFDWIPGVTSNSEQLTEAMGNLDKVLAGMDISKAQDMFRGWVEEAKLSEDQTRNLINAMPAYRSALEGAANAQGIMATDANLVKLAMGDIKLSSQGAADGLGETTTALDAAKDASSAAYDELSKLANAFLDGRQAARNYAEETKKAAAAARENGKHWDDNTKAAAANAEAIDSMASSAMKTASTLEGADRVEYMKQARKDLIKTAMLMDASKEEAEDYVNQLGLTPEAISTQVELHSDEAQAKLDAYKEKFGTVPPKVLTEAGLDTKNAELKFDYMDYEGEQYSSSNPTTTVSAETGAAAAALLGLSQDANSITGVVTVTGNTGPAKENVDAFRSTVNDMGGTVTINGSTVNADTALNKLISEVAHSDGTVTINGQSVPAKNALTTLINQVNAGKGTVTINGNNGPAKKKTDEAVADANKAHGTIAVTAATGLANAAIDRAARDRTARINVVATGAIGFANAVLHRASGGPIYGPGTGTSDSVPMRGSNGEHVWTAREVALAGGQAAMYRMRRAVSIGELRFRDGGGIAAGTYAPAPRLLPAGQVVAAQAPAGRKERAAVPSTLVIQDADGTFLGRMRTVGTDAAVSVVNQR